MELARAPKRLKKGGTRHNITLLSDVLEHVVISMQRSTSVWYDDGNIILQAETMQFKAYRGILADNSNIFKDMFRVPQPSNDTLVEGCIVIEMQDGAQDLEYFLHAIHKAR